MEHDLSEVVTEAVRELSIGPVLRQATEETVGHVNLLEPCQGSHPFHDFHISEIVNCRN